MDSNESNELNKKQKQIKSFQDNIWWIVIVIVVLIFGFKLIPHDQEGQQKELSSVPRKPALPVEIISEADFFQDEKNTRKHIKVTNHLLKPITVRVYLNDDFFGAVELRRDGQTDIDYTDDKSQKHNETGELQSFKKGQIVTLQAEGYEYLNYTVQ